MDLLKMQVTMNLNRFETATVTNTEYENLSESSSPMNKLDDTSSTFNKQTSGE